MNGQFNSLLDHGVINRLSQIMVRPRGLMEGNFTGMHRSPHRGSSVEFAEYRKYVPGDDIRYIDWRVYAKTDRFYLKEFEADTNLRCHFLVDASASMGFTGKHGAKLDYVKKMVASLAYILLKQGDNVGLQCFNTSLLHDFPARGNPVHLRNILNTLSSLDSKGQTEFGTILHSLAASIRRRAMVIVFSDFFTDVDELLNCFQHMSFRKHDLVVFHVLDPQELDFEFDRPIRFYDLESSFSLVTDPNTIQKQYFVTIRHYMDRLSNGCRELKVDYRFVSIDKNYEDILSKFLLERIRK